jgi:circadian clock protein KaiC
MKKGFDMTSKMNELPTLLLTNLQERKTGKPDNVSELSKAPIESKRVPTGIAELDQVMGGGFPLNSLILLSGNAGSGKTILSAQFLYNGATKFGEKGLYVSFAENKNDYCRNMLLLGMDMKNLEQKGLFKFMEMTTMKGEAALTIITEQIMKTIMELKMKRIVIDSLSALLQTMNVGQVRVFLHNVLNKLVKNIGATTILIGEIPYGESKTGFGVEEFIADGVILLTHMDKIDSSNRRITIAKMRGTALDRTSMEYLIDKKFGGIGPIVLPRKANILFSPTEKLSTGIKGLDEMLHGGVFRGSVTLIEGESGVGKTIACLQFLAENAIKGERTVYISLEQPIGQIMRTAKTLGYDLKKLGKHFFVESYIPEAFTTLEYYNLLKELIDTHAPSVLAFDPMTAMQRVMSNKDFSNFGRYIQLMSKQNEMTVFLTSTLGASEASEAPSISILTDNIIKMRYSEVKDMLGRQMFVVKSRGSGHDNVIRPFEITEKGMEVQTHLAKQKKA